MHTSGYLRTLPPLALQQPEHYLNDNDVTSPRQLAQSYLKFKR